MIRRTSVQWTRVAVLMAAGVVGAAMLFRAGWESAALLQLATILLLTVFLLLQRPGHDPVHAEIQRSVRKVGARQEKP